MHSRDFWRIAITLPEESLITHKDVYCSYNVAYMVNWFFFTVYEHAIYIHPVPYKF